MKDSDALFNRILISVGDHGWFQRRYYFLFVFLMGLAATMAYMNLIIIMAVPAHWCRIPGLENSTYSSSWKDLYLPKELDARGKLSHSSCNMYNLSVIQSGKKPSEEDIVPCQFGYDYDNTWYTRTVPTDQNWVCEKGLYVSNILATSRFSKVVGLFIFGQLGDCIGRRWTLIISLVLCLASKIVSVFTSHLYYVFMISSAMSIFPAVSAVQSSLVIAMEISNDNKRAWLSQLQNISWATALIIMPLICWVFPNWIVFYTISNAPLIIFIAASGLMMIESPRWLASRGRINECVKELEKIAKTNGTKPDPELIAQLRDHPNEPEKSFGILSTISSWRLAKNTVILTVNMVISVLMQFLLILNFTNLDGNPFLNFLWQSAIEIPSYIIGKWSCDKLGRRLSCSLAFLLTAAMCVPIILAIRDDDMASIINTLVIAMKFFMASTFYVISLQTMEIYPTCVRQSGMSLGLAVSGAFCVVGPYIIYMGTSIDARYPYVIIAVMGAASAFLNAFLPETLHAKLPETLQEARDFGKEQHFFSMPKKRRETAPPEKMKFIDAKKPID